MTVALLNSNTNESEIIGCLYDVSALLNDEWREEMDYNPFVNEHYAAILTSHINDFHSLQRMLLGRVVWHECFTELGFNRNPHNGEMYYTHEQIADFASRGELTIHGVKETTAWQWHITTAPYRAFYYAEFLDKYLYVLNKYSDTKHITTLAWALTHFIVQVDNSGEYLLNTVSIYQDETMFNSVSVSVGLAQLGMLTNADIIPDTKLMENYSVLNIYKDNIRDLFNSVEVDTKIFSSEDPIKAALDFGVKMIELNKEATNG